MVGCVHIGWNHAMLIVALGSQTYRVSRPFGHWPTNTGHVADVTVTPAGHPLVMLRHDPYLHPFDDRVVELDDAGAFLRGWAVRTSPIPIR